MDTVRVHVRCPFCGNATLRDISTLDLHCNHHIYEVGDPINSDLRGLEHIKSLIGTAQCQTTDCLDELTKAGTPNPSGRTLTIQIFIEDGLITDNYKVLKNI